MIDPMINHSSG